MEDNLFLAWAAGFFDGEGCVIVEISKEKRCRHGFRTALHATVAQTSLPCLELFRDRFGGSIKTSANCTPNGRRWSVQHIWVVRNENAVEFLRAIQPYTVVKREQIDVALDYPLSAPNGKKYGNVSNPIPDDVQDYRVAIAYKLRDIRSSMKVPAGPAKEKVNA